MMAHSPRLQALLEAARQRIQAGAGIPNEQFWEEVASEQASSKGSSKRKKRA